MKQVFRNQGELLRTAIENFQKKTGVSLKTICEKSNISRRTMYNLFNRMEIQPYYLYQLSSATGHDFVKEVLGKTGQPNKNYPEQSDSGPLKIVDEPLMKAFGLKTQMDEQAEKIANMEKEMKYLFDANEMLKEINKNLRNEIRILNQKITNASQNDEDNT